MKMAKNESTAYVNDIWDQKFIAVLLCKIDGENFAHVSARLREDVHVAKAAFSNENGSVSVSTIKKCPQTLFQVNHDLAAMAVKACRDTWSPYHVQSDFLRHMGDRLFSCKSFFLAWVQRGWRTGTHRGEILLLFRIGPRHCSGSYQERQISKYSRSLFVLPSVSSPRKQRLYDGGCDGQPSGFQGG